VKHLNERAHFTLSEACRRALYKYIDLKGRSQPVNQAKIFSIEEIKTLFSKESTTLPQVRDKIIFALGVCTLARSSELKSMKVEDLDLKEDGLVVIVHRKKAAVSRATQKIWVNKTFFGWNLLENIKTYLKFIPSEGPLWRCIAPHPKENKEAAESRVLAPSTIDGIPAKLTFSMKLKDWRNYHSHSLRRSGATLLAIMGRTEEQIKVMGNWTSSAAASRYIDTSEVTLRTNAGAIALDENFRCSLLEQVAPLVLPATKPTETDEPDAEEEVPCAKKPRLGNVCFMGDIKKVIVVSSLPVAHQKL